MEKGKKKKKTMFIVIIAIVVIVVGILSSSEENEPKKVDNDNVQTADNQNNTPTDDTNKEFTVGDSVELNGIIVTFNEIIESTGSIFIEPSEGNIFVLPVFTIENNSDKELTMSTLLSFDAYQDGYATSLSLSALMVNDNLEQLDGSIVPNKKMKGALGYEIPSDYSELEINIQLGVWSSKKITFVYRK